METASNTQRTAHQSTPLFGKLSPADYLGLSRGFSL